MKRSEYRKKRIIHHEREMGYFATASGSAEKKTATKRADLDIEAAEAAGVTWDPEEPEGFEEWYARWCELPGRPTASDIALAAWNACLARQGAAKEPWHAGMSFDEIRHAIQQGVAPGSGEPGGHVTVPRGYFHWLAFQVRHDEAQRRTKEEKVDPEVRRQEIEIQIEAWADFQLDNDAHLGRPDKQGWISAAHGLLRHYLHLEY